MSHPGLNSFALWSFRFAYLYSVWNTYPMTTQAIAYIRVSSDLQAEKGISIEAQKAAVLAYAASKGLTLCDVVVDAGVSAGVALAKREGGKRVVAAVKSKKVDVVIAVRLDRLFRNAGECLTTIDLWSKKNVALVLLDCGGMELDSANPISKMVLTFMAGIAEHEKVLVGARTKAALDHKRSKGLRTNIRAPIGFKFQDGMVVEHAEEQVALKQIRALHQAGFSAGRIAKALNDRGVPARGDRWWKTTIQRLVA